MMALSRAVVLLALLPYSCLAVTATAGMGSAANPIRRVVTMLQMMQKKITDEGAAEEKLFDKFMCFCNTGAGQLQKTIDDATTKIPQLESDLEEGAAEKSQLASDITQAKRDRDEAKATMAEATALREKESGEFAKDSAEDNANLEAMAKAIAALERGAGGGFLQTSAADIIKHLANTMDMEDSDHDALLSFLAQGQGGSDGYAPQSGEITGILKQMKDTTAKDAADATATEEGSKKDYAALMEAKTKQVTVLQKAIESKTSREGEVKVDLVNNAEDLDDTKTSLSEDSKFIANLGESCKKKKAEWEARQKTRSEELVAVSETIKLLNDDDALDLFKKTLPGTSLLQVMVSSKQMIREARQALHGARGSRDHRLDFIALALRGRKVNFDKVTAMIDDMVSLLKKEQNDDDAKKVYCTQGLDEADDEKKSLERAVSDLEKTIAENKEAADAASEEIVALAKGIKELDQDVAEATAQRKEEHKEYVEDLAANSAAKEIIKIAINRMNKFYNKALYKEAPKRELTESERITVNNGGTLAPTAPPGGIAGTGVEAFLQTSMRSRTGQAPETPEGEYKKSSEESSGVIGMMNIMIKNLDKEIQQMEFEEKDSQADYDTFMADSAEKRAANVKSLAGKEGVKADLEASLQEHDASHKAKLKEAYANAKYITDLHLECDWLLQNMDTRKQARDGEIDSLQKAKAVLSGADYSLIQTGHRHRQIVWHQRK